MLKPNAERDLQGETGAAAWRETTGKSTLNAHHPARNTSGPRGQRDHQFLCRYEGSVPQEEVGVGRIIENGILSLEDVHFEPSVKVSRTHRG